MLPQMVLLPAGMVLGRVMADKMARRSVAAVPSTSAMLAPSSRATAMANTQAYHISRRRYQRENGHNPFEHDEILRRAGGLRFRRGAATEARRREELEDALQNANWTAIYRYRSIWIAAFMARLKLLQTIATICYLPWAVYEHSTGGMATDWFTTTCVLAIVAPIMLAATSRYERMLEARKTKHRYTNRLIGVIAMNETEEYVRVGYLSFWGSRRNVFLEVADVLPVTELASSSAEWITQFRWYSSTSFLYLPLHKVELPDERKAEVLFGDLSLFVLHDGGALRKRGE